MIWHYFKKDWKLLWPLVTIVAAVHILNAVIWFMLDHFGGLRALATIANEFPAAVLLGIAVLIVTMVHQDAVPGDRQDWLVRPIHRRDLILEKLLFLLIAIQGPMLLVDLVHCMATGFSFSDSLSAALSRNVYVLLAISLPVLALATITSTIVEVIGVGLAIFLSIVVFTIAMQAGISNPGAGSSFTSISNGWLMLRLWSAVALTAAAVVIPLQYFRRATRQAQGIVVGAILVLFSASLLIPWSSAFAFLQWLSPDPAAAKTVALAFDPTLGKIALKPGAVNPANSVWVPLHVSGLAPESIVLNDRAYVQIIGRDGTILFRGLSTGDPQVTVDSRGIPLDIDDFPVKTAAGNDVRTHQLISLPQKIYESVRGQTVRLELDYGLTLFRIDASDRIAALNGDKPIANLGSCKTKPDVNGNAVDFTCLSTREVPICRAFVLENAVSGQRNPTLDACRKFYLPYNAHFDPDALSRIGVRLPFRDPQGLAKYPVDSTQLAEAQILVKTYQPVAHFTRHLTIPEIRLGDWEAETTVAAATTPPAR